MLATEVASAFFSRTTATVWTSVWSISFSRSESTVTRRRTLLAASLMTMAFRSPEALTMPACSSTSGFSRSTAAWASMVLSSARCVTYWSPSGTWSGSRPVPSSEPRVLVRLLDSTTTSFAASSLVIPKPLTDSQASRMWNAASAATSTWVVMVTLPVSSGGTRNT